MIINSISPEIGRTLHAGNVAKARDDSGNEPADTKASASKPSAANPTRSTATELLGPGQNQSAGGDDSKAPVPLLVNGLGLGLKFSLDKETDTRVIEVIDLKSGEVVRQIPPKEVLNFLREVRDSKGVFVSRRL